MKQPRWQFSVLILSVVATTSALARAPERMISPPPPSLSDPAPYPLGRTDANPIVFPDTFMFGTATAGFQVDMGCPDDPLGDCLDANSDWYAFSTHPDVINSTTAFLSGQDPAVVGPGFYQLYEEDLDRVAYELEHNAFRMGLEWSRIFPEATDGIEGYGDLINVANIEAIDHYHRVFAALRARGITPMVTVNHYSLPLWIHNGAECHLNYNTCGHKGWRDKERTVDELAKFAGFVAQEFGAEVDLWATENEPLAVVLPGFLAPSPGRTNPPAEFAKAEGATTTYLGLIEAHARMYDAIKAGDRWDVDRDGLNSKVGIVYNMSPVKPWDENNPLDVQAAKNVFYLWNTAFLNAVCQGMLDDDLDGVAEYREDLDNRMDYVGINYYTRITVGGLRFSIMPRFSPLATFNPFQMQAWEDYDKGLYEMIKYVWDTYRLPSIVTENGAEDPDDDGTGASYLVRHLTWVGKAVEEGLPVTGYFYWTLMDNVEWNHGMNVRMGLYAVDADDPDKVRTPRQAVPYYAEIARTHTISTALQTQFPATP